MKAAKNLTVLPLLCLTFLKIESQSDSDLLFSHEVFVTFFADKVFNRISILDLVKIM